jgi:hypothetical protein
MVRLRVDVLADGAAAGTCRFDEALGSELEADARAAFG